MPTPRPQEGLHSAGERDLLLGMLEWYRDGVVQKVTGLSPEHLTASPVSSGTTVAGLLKHLAYVEDTWFHHRLGGHPEVEPWASAPFDQDVDWEYHHADEPLPELLDLYAAACRRSRAVTAARQLEDLATDDRGRRISVRFVIVHLIEETARHLGHLDILCELLDGRTGE